MVTGQWLKRLWTRSPYARSRLLRRNTQVIQTCESRVLLSAVPVGGEVNVNSTTTGAQALPDIACDANGNYIIAWQSNGQDGDGNGIYAQRYNASGVAQGGEFRVNSFTTGEQTAPRVAMDADGDFIITWVSNEQDGNSTGIYAQRYNAAGVAQGSGFLVNTFTTGSQSSARIAADDLGNFVIAWNSDAQDGSNLGIYAQRYDNTGATVGGEFVVNTYTTGAQRLGDVAMDANGDFIVTWESDQTGGFDLDIYAQRFDSTGTMQGSEFRINAETNGAQFTSAVAMDDSGDFVVSWTGYSVGGMLDGSGFGIYAQRFNATGMSQGAEFRVNAITTGNQAFSDISLDADGDFVVTWVDVLNEGDGYGVYAQRYNATGVTQGAQFLVNTTTILNQSNPAIALDATGDFVIAWDSYAQDTDNFGIAAQRYRSNTPPTISGGQTFTINEHMANGASVGTVTASDADIGDSLTYQFSGGNVGQAFAINSTTGEITVNKKAAVDFERLTSFSLRVQVTDQAKVSRKATVTVNLNDLNEMPRISPQMFSIDENSPNGTVVGTVLASDVDAGDVLSYAITGGNVGKAFAINSSTGQITVAKSSLLDFETQPTFSLTVEVTDAMGLKRKAVVTINLNNLMEP